MERRSSRERKEVQRLQYADDSDSDNVQTRRKRVSKNVICDISDSENEFEDKAPVTNPSRSKKRDSQTKTDNSFKQFGFVVTDKKTAVASMTSITTDSKLTTKTASRKKPKSTTATGKIQSSSNSRRSQRATSSVNYADPGSDDGSNEDNESSMSGNGSEVDSEGSVEEVAPRPTKAKNPSSSTTSKKRGTRAGASDSLASLPPQDTVSSRRRSALAREQGLPTRSISYAEQGSDDEMFILTGSEDEDRGSKRSKKKVSGGKSTKKSKKSAEGSNRSEAEESSIESRGSESEAGSGSSDEDNEEGFRYKIHFILGTEVHTAAEWVPICQAIDTREVTRGSVWQQSDDEFFSTSDTPIAKFLIKWTHASYLHVSWETEHDLVNMVGNAAKTQIKRFRQTAVNGVACGVFDDLRVGEYFPPNYLTIDRVLDVDDEKVEMTQVDWAVAPLPPRDIWDKEDIPSDGEEEQDEESKKHDGDLVGELSAPPETEAVPTSINEEEEAEAEETDFRSAAISTTEKVEEETEDTAVNSSNQMEQEQDVSSPPRRRASSRTASAVARLMLADMVEKPSPERAQRSKKQTRKEAAQSRQRQRTMDGKNSDAEKSVVGKKKSTKKVEVYPYLHSEKCFVTVKWDNLPYAETSFEDINDLIKYQIDYEKPLRMFYQREQSTPAKNSRRNYKRKLEAELLQSDTGPEFEAGELRDYQWTGVRWLLFSWSQRRNTILADEMGLGKTIQTAAFLHILKNFQGVRGPFLIVAPLSTIVQWQREISAWTNLDAIIYHGSQDDRELAREYDFFYNSKNRSEGYKMEVVITTPETCTAFDNPKATRLSRELSKVHWDMLIVDEAHKLKNYSSKLSTTLRDEYSYSNCVLLTGTPLQNSTEELWTLLNFVDNNAFQYHEEFAKEFGDLKESSQLEKLQKKLGPYLLRRQKENVEKSVPPKEEIIVEVELTVPQKQYYRAIYEQNKSFLFRGATKDGPRLTNLAMELRKCCNHPYLIRGAELELIKHYTADGAEKSHVDMMVESSGKLVLLDKLLPKLRADGHRVLIFSQFRIMLDILEDYLNLRYFTHERVDGAVTGKKRQSAIDKFSAADSNIFVMLLSTRAGGVGINLTAADTVIIFDSDWNPQNDIQAQARAHRIGQTQPVKVYRLLTCKTYEMEMFRAASLKLGLDYAIMHNMKGGERNSSGGSLSVKELESLLKHGAYDIFREEKEGQSEQSSTQFCEAGIDSILERSMVVMHGGDGVQKPTANFSKASFVAAGSDNLDINDPDFWTKIVGLNVVDDIDEAPRKRKCTENIGSYSEPNKVDQLFLMESDSDFSDSGQPGASKKAKGSGPEKRRKKSTEAKVVPADWTPNNLNVLLAALVIHGYGNWEAIRVGAGLHYSLSDIAKGCRNLILFLYRVVGFASVGAEVSQLTGNHMESYKIMPGDPVDKYDSAVALMSIMNNNVVVKLAILAQAIQRNVDALPEGAKDQPVLPFLPPIPSGELIETMMMEALFIRPSLIPTPYHYIPHREALWGSDTVDSTLQVLRQLSLPPEFTKYEEYLSSSKLRVGIASKLELIQDQFALFHAVEIEKYRRQLSSSQSLSHHLTSDVEGQNGVVDDVDARIRASLPYPFPATSSLQAFLIENLVVEDAPSDWWVTGADDLILIEGIVKYGMPDKANRLNAIEKYMERADPGPRHRPPPAPNPEIDEDIFLIGGQGYSKDDATRSVVESEFFLDKGDTMKRVKEIISLFRPSSSIRTSYFHSEVVRAMAKYGVPTETTEEARELYLNGTRKFSYFEKSRPTSTATIEVDLEAGADDTVRAIATTTEDPEDKGRLDRLPTWNGLALLTECNIVRYNALKKFATSVYTGAPLACGLSKSTLQSGRSKANSMTNVRLFLFCYDEADALQMLSKMPQNSASCTLWWTTAHDLRLMHLLCKHGFGNWKAMCDDNTPGLIVTEVPKGFVVPAREPSDAAAAAPDRIVVDTSMISLRVNFLVSCLSVWVNLAKPVDTAKEKTVAPKVSSAAARVGKLQIQARPTLPPRPLLSTSSSAQEEVTATPILSNPSSGGSSDAPIPAMFSLMRKPSPTAMKEPPSSGESLSVEKPVDLQVELNMDRAIPSIVDLSSISPQNSSEHCKDTTDMASDSPATLPIPPASTTSSSSESSVIDAVKQSFSMCTPSPLTVSSQLSPGDSTAPNNSRPPTPNSMDSVNQKRSIDVVIDVDTDDKQDGEAAGASGVECTPSTSREAKRQKVVAPSDHPKMKTITSFFQKKSSQ